MFLLFVACALVTAQERPALLEHTQPVKLAPGQAARLLCGSSETPRQDNRDTVRQRAGTDTLCGPVPQPSYPAEAKKKGIQGTVRLKAIITPAGTVRELFVVDGHPLLVPAAIDAVKRWKYKPYYLKGKPVEVETNVIVNFTLAKG